MLGKLIAFPDGRGGYTPVTLERSRIIDVMKGSRYCCLCTGLFMGIFIGWIAR